ncbi:ACT domain-containing protein [Nitrospinae bacterium AH_259_B05_G02_I21]|nr:ACT domain-containing protein [Nitrospinae bacterium AH_259_B05_G02_I21]MDA2932193.1 ACT domain-containing protein [Nitrospinae bacterium AH-259-F20]
MSRKWRAGDIIEINDEGDATKKQPHVIRIEVETLDRPGSLAEVTKAIADCQINISECIVSTMGERHAQVHFALEIIDDKQLEHMMGKVRKLETVLNVRQIIGRYRRVEIVARIDIDEDGQRWAELQNGEKINPDSTSYCNLTIEAEERVVRQAREVDEARSI